MRKLLILVISVLIPLFLFGGFLMRISGIIYFPSGNYPIDYITAFILMGVPFILYLFLILLVTEDAKKYKEPYVWTIMTVLTGSLAGIAYYLDKK